MKLDKATADPEEPCKEWVRMIKPGQVGAGGSKERSISHSTGIRKK